MRQERRWEEAGDNRIAMVEALADELAEDLVTKADLDGAVQQLRAEMQGLRAEMYGLRSEMHDSRTDTEKWVAGLLLIHAFGVVGNDRRPDRGAGVIGEMDAMCGRECRGNPALSRE